MRSSLWVCVSRRMCRLCVGLAPTFRRQLRLLLSLLGIWACVGFETNGYFARRLTSYPLANFFWVPFIFGSRLFAGVLGPPKIPAGAAVSQSRFKIKLKTSTSSGG